MVHFNSKSLWNSGFRFFSMQLRFVMEHIAFFMAKCSALILTAPEPTVWQIKCFYENFLVEWETTRGREEDERDFSGEAV